MPRPYKTPPGRSEQARKAAFASQRPDVLAKRIGKAWPKLDDEQRREVLENLAPLAEQPRAVDS